MAVVTGNGVDGVVDGFEAVCVAGAARDPRFVAKLSEVAVRSEKVVKTVLERDLVVGNLCCY